MCVLFDATVKLSRKVWSKHSALIGLAIRILVGQFAIADNMDDIHHLKEFKKYTKNLTIPWD